MTIDRAVIGENAKNAREYNGFSQISVARFLGVDQSLISKFEKGERTIQSEMLERLATLYGCTITDFLSAGDVPEQQVKTAYRSSGITPDDMVIIHDIRRIARNLFFMSSLAGGEGIEKQV